MAKVRFIEALFESGTDHHKLALIEVYVVITALATAFLAVCGSGRRRYRNSFFKFIVWTTYVLPAYVITYTIGLMRTAPFQNELFALWASFLLIVYGSADSISAFSLEDNEQWKQYYFRVMLQNVWVFLLVQFYRTAQTKFNLPLTVLGVFLLYKAGERVQAFQLATKSMLATNTKLVADFMDHKHQSGEDEEVDPVLMKGYNYLVTGEDEKKVKVTPPHYQKQLEITHEVITVEKIWQCQGTFLNETGDPDHRLKDICLSFALFRLLCRRFGGYSFSESTQEKTWKFIRDGLLSEEDDYERAFRVVEVELSFLYDLFYTKYAVIFRGGKGFQPLKMVEFIFITIGCWLAANVLINYKPRDGYLNLVTAGGIDVDKVVTGVAIVAMVFMEVVQIILIMLSDWANVQWICRYVKCSRSLQNNKLFILWMKIMCCRKGLKPWERKLGQYCLLESFDHKPNVLIYNSFTFALFAKPRNGQKENRPVKLPAEVKKAVILSLKIHGPNLSNGEASLHRNGMGNELSWSCRLETPTHVIMVWHIATTLCQIASASPPESRGWEEHFVVATRLSGYCAYLVVYAPRLLPGRAPETEFIFDQVVEEAKQYLVGCDSNGDKYHKLMKLESDEETIIQRGARLGRQLLEQIPESDAMWKVLADFWAELMLSLAPSGDPIAHAEHLAKGGEFVTHLWALLSHGGIVHQGSSQAEV